MTQLRIQRKDFLAYRSLTAFFLYKVANAAIQILIPFLIDMAV